ncbi:hypothetical protein HMI55_003133 [Coelomomyces lativittatus]|nr:hypothetical protein HMI55_003133 [Coelomomyces lativittatus]
MISLEVLERALAIPDDILKPWVASKKKQKLISRVEVQAPTQLKLLTVQPRLATPKRKKWTRPLVNLSKRVQQMKLEKSSGIPAASTNPFSVTKILRSQQVVPLKLNIARICSKDGMVEMEPYSIYWLDHVRDSELRKRKKK